MANSKNVLSLSSVDATKSINANDKTRKKSLTLASIDSYRPRDMLLYNQTESLKNIEMENTKELRQKQINRMKNLRKMGPFVSSLFSSTVQLGS